MPKAEVEDAMKVSKGLDIVTYMSKEKKQISEKIAKLDEKIQEAMESKQTILPNDVKTIDSDIEIYLYSSIKGNTNIYSLYEQKKVLNEKIEKKAKIVGELSPVGSQLKSLIEERTSYEKQLNNSEKKIKAPKAGLVSYRIDNYENLLKPSSFSKLTIEELKKIKIPTDQVIPLNLNNVKIVNNFECYIAVPVYSEESKNVTLNSNVYLRFDNVGSELISATVEYILDETETSESGEAGKNKSGKIIVFKILTNVEELTKYRKINVDVVWWSDKGLKVNKEALSKVQMTNVSGDTIELSTLKIKKSSYTQEAWVKIVRSAGDFVIVENYTDKELREKGISELQINNRATIKMYDEVLIEKQKE